MKRNDPFKKPPTFCYKCKKDIYPSEGAAKAKASEKIKTGKIEAAEHLYVYVCPRGNGFHLTSQKINHGVSNPKKSKKKPTYQSKNRNQPFIKK